MGEPHLPFVLFPAVAPACSGAPAPSPSCSNVPDGVIVLGDRSLRAAAACGLQHQLQQQHFSASAAHCPASAATCAFAGCRGDAPAATLLEASSACVDAPSAATCVLYSADVCLNLADVQLPSASASHGAAYASSSGTLGMPSSGHSSFAGDDDSCVPEPACVSLPPAGADLLSACCADAPSVALAPSRFACLADAPLARGVSASQCTPRHASADVRMSRFRSVSGLQCVEACAAFEASSADAPSVSLAPSRFACPADAPLARGVSASQCTPRHASDDVHMSRFRSVSGLQSAEACAAFGLLLLSL